MINQTRLQSLRSRLKQGQPSVGSWMQLGSRSIAEILASSNFDWLVVDHEHGINVPQPESLYSTISNSTLPFARIASFSHHEAIRSLEAGAAGIIVPNLTDSETWRVFTNKVKWPPNGSRGVGFCAANGFGSYFDDYKVLAADPFLVPMIESKEGIRALREVAYSQNVDAILIGPYDLSASMGCLGDFKCISFIQALNEILDICKAHKVPAGIHVVQPDSAKLHNYIHDGFQFLAYGMDSTMLRCLNNPIAQ